MIVRGEVSEGRGRRVDSRVYSRVRSRIRVECELFLSRVAMVVKLMAVVWLDG